MNATARGMMRSVAAFAVAAGVLGLVVPMFCPGTNCGGNAAALWSVSLYASMAQDAAAKDPEGRFRVASAAGPLRKELEWFAQSSRLPSARFLVRPGGCRQDGSDEPRRIIIVCDRAYRNVPRTFLGLAPPTHAAGYSDGTTGLIPVAEFRALDRSALVPLDDLLAGTLP